MKKTLLIFLLAVMVLCSSLCLVGCKENSPSEANGYFADVECDGTNAQVQVAYAQDGAFTLYTFKLTDNALSEEDLRQKVLSAFNDTAAYPDALELQVKNGTYVYLNNAFIIRRLSVTYEGGKTEKCYINFTDKTFELSPSMGSVLLYCLVGIAITFLVLMFLMGVIKILSFAVEKITAKRKKSKETAVEQSTLQQPAAVAKGSAGELVLRGISEKDAALVMAIVADELQAPLNTLKFISITDITDSEDAK